MDVLEFTYSLSFALAARSLLVLKDNEKIKQQGFTRKQ
jgi:hypothetical protein